MTWTKPWTESNFINGKEGLHRLVVPSLAVKIVATTACVNTVATTTCLQWKYKLVEFPNWEVEQAILIVIWKSSIWEETQGKFA